MGAAAQSTAAVPLSCLFSATSTGHRVWPLKCLIHCKAERMCPHFFRSYWRFPMFRGEFNPMLDNFYFRAALTITGFLAWMGASYLLLSL
jgi:hypothetical protein